MPPLRVLVVSEIAGLREAAAAAVRRRLGASAAARIDWVERSAASLRGPQVGEGGDPSSSRAELLSARVMLADPGAVAELIDDAVALEWMQSTWAGVNALFDRSTKRDYTCTRVAGCFGPLMAECAASHRLHGSQLQLSCCWR